ncbi:MAG: methyltransferase domain-containing protein [Burkholderiales bacterium]
MAVQQFDEQTSRRVEAIYLTPDVAQHRARVLELLGAKRGEYALDIGCGPGFLAESLARAVGQSGRVDAVDASDSMLAIAQRRCAGLPHVQVGKADAQSLPFGDASFDLAAVLQVYEFVPEVDRAIAELARVLRPGARAAIMDTDWESAVWASGDDARMRRVLEAWDEHVPHPRLVRALAAKLRDHGLEPAGIEVLPLLNARFDPDTYSAGMIEVIAGYVAGRPGIPENEVRAWKDDLAERARRGEYFFSLNRYVFMVEKKRQPG